MEYIISIIEYFGANPLKILFLLGGSGGLFYWYDRFRNRKRIEVEIIEENYYSEREIPNIEFKIQNLCVEPSSLAPNVILKAQTPKGEKFSTSFLIDIEDLHLPHLTPKVVKAVVTSDISFGTLGTAWYKTYLFISTNTGKKRIYFRYADIQLKSFFRYDFELFLYRWFNHKVINK